MLSWIKSTYDEKIPRTYPLAFNYPLNISIHVHAVCSKQTQPAHNKINNCVYKFKCTACMYVCMHVDIFVLINK